MKTNEHLSVGDEVRFAPERSILTMEECSLCSHLMVPEPKEGWEQGDYSKLKQIGVRIVGSDIKPAICLDCVGGTELNKWFEESESEDDSEFFKS